MDDPVMTAVDERGESGTDDGSSECREIRSTLHERDVGKSRPQGRTGGIWIKQRVGTE